MKSLIMVASAAFISLASGVHADEGIFDPEAFSRALEGERRSPTEQESLSSLFAIYPTLPFEIKFNAHVRCIALSFLGRKAGLVSSGDAESVIASHGHAMSVAAETSEEARRAGAPDASLTKAAMIYDVAGVEHSVGRDFAACMSYTQRLTGT